MTRELDSEPCCRATGPYPERLKEIVSPSRASGSRRRCLRLAGLRADATADGGTAGVAAGSGGGAGEGRVDGLASFKALGGAYGVLRAGEDGAPQVVTCASDGNHGRAVAWGARMFGPTGGGLPAQPRNGVAGGGRSGRWGRGWSGWRGSTTKRWRERLGDAEASGWTVVSDTSYEGYDEVPRLVMQGYTVMVEEAVGQIGGAPPTHVFVQGGVGGLAAAVVGHLWESFGAERPVAVVVEPATSDGLYQSALAGRPTASRGSLETIMAGLSCREVSPLAWEVVSAGVHAFATVADHGVAPMMRAAAGGELGDAFEGGESGVAGLLGLVEAARRPGAAGGRGAGLPVAGSGLQHRGGDGPGAVPADRGPGLPRA